MASKSVAAEHNRRRFVREWRKAVSGGRAAGFLNHKRAALVAWRGFQRGIARSIA